MNVGNKRFKKDLFGDQIYDKLSQRDKHPLFARKEQIQLFHVRETGKTYQLIGGISNANFQEVKAGGGIPKWDSYHKTYFVDKLNPLASDTTGEANDPKKPFMTIKAASNAASLHFNATGDSVLVHVKKNGVYNEADITKHGVDMYFEEWVIVYSSWAGQAPISDRLFGANGKWFNIYGQGRFYNTISTPSNDSDAINMRFDTRFTFQAAEFCSIQLWKAYSGKYPLIIQNCRILNYSGIKQNDRMIDCEFAQGILAIAHVGVRNTYVLPADPLLARQVKDVAGNVLFSIQCPNRTVRDVSAMTSLQVKDAFTSPVPADDATVAVQFYERYQGTGIRASLTDCRIIIRREKCMGFRFFQNVDFTTGDPNYHFINVQVLDETTGKDTHGWVLNTKSSYLKKAKLDLEACSTDAKFPLSACPGYIIWEQTYTRISDPKQTPGGTTAISTAVTHAELVNLANTAALVPGMQYRFPYTAKWIDPLDGVTVRTATTIEELTVEAVSTAKVSGVASSVQFPSDEIYLDALATTNGSTGVIQRRIDAQGNEAFYDWRNITFKRFNVTGIVHAVATFKKLADGVTDSTTAMQVTVPAGTYMPANNRYAEFCLQLPAVHGASPTLHVKLDGSTTEFVDIPLYQTDGVTPFTASYAGNVTGQTGKMLIYYSVELGRFIGHSNVVYENALKGHFSYLNANLSIGNGLTLAVDPLAVVEAYTFGSRTPTCKNVKVGIHPGRLPNVVIVDSSNTANVEISANSEDSTIIPDTIRACQLAKGKLVKTIIKGLVSEWEFGENGAVSSIIYNGRGDTTTNHVNNFFIKHRNSDFVIRDQFANITLMHGNHNITRSVSAGWMRHEELGLSYGNIANGSFRALNLTMWDFALSISSMERGWFNINQHWNQASFKHIRARAYEHGAVRTDYIEHGEYRVNGNASFRNKINSDVHSFRHAETIVMSNGSAMVSGAVTVDFVSPRVHLGLAGITEVTLKGGVDGSRYFIKLLHSASGPYRGANLTWTNLLNPPVLPASVSTDTDTFMIAITKVANSYVCEFWAAIPDSEPLTAYGL